MAPSAEPVAEAAPTSPVLLQKIPQISNGEVSIDPNFEVKNSVSIPQRVKFEIEDHPINISPSLKVAIIGAGLSGITAGVLLPIKVPGIDLQIFDKNADVGGTWFENIYPGVRCGIPANVYQSTFEPRTQWTEEYAQGHEIRDYWQHVARKYHVYKYLRPSRKIAAATWGAETGKWTLEVENLVTGEKYEEAFDVVITATGRFNAWKLPDYPGINEYEGHLRHSSNWDPNFDPAGKTVAVIGNGASGIQVVPNIQKVVKHLDHYARSKTWIAGTFGNEGEGRRLEPNYYSEELLKSFQDPDTYHKFRKDLESKFYRRFGSLFKNSEINNGMREDFVKLMAARLAKKPELLDSLIPDFSPNCRRLTPGPGYLEAITEDNVSYIQTAISHFTKEGIVTADGVERKVDAVICSTGANIDMRPPYPIVANGEDLRDIWTPDPISYLGVAAPNFPNLLFIQGPNGAGHSGTVPNQVETQVTYIAKVLRKVSTQGIKSFSPSQEAVDDFTTYCDAFFPRTVSSENCSSWANGGKPGGRIHGHWPGSASHLNFVRKEPRWEDWAWEVKSQTGNRFAWFGNGWTENEASGEGDLTGYLKKPEEINLRSYHEEWFEGL